MKKIIATMLVSTIFLAGSARADSYALEGMGIGVGSGVAIGFITAAADKAADQECSDDCNLGFVVIPILFGALGTLVGSGIGALIPKHPKISLTPVVAPSQNGMNVGGNLEFRF